MGADLIMNRHKDTNRRLLYQAVFLLVAGGMALVVWHRSFHYRSPDNYVVRLPLESGLRDRARFLQELWHAGGKEGGFSDVPGLEEHVRQYLARSNPYGRDYLVVVVTDEPYVIEVPRENDSRVCVLCRDGYVAFEPLLPGNRSDLQRYMHRIHENLQRQSRSIPKTP
jgi:hypothetical protein